MKGWVVSCSSMLRSSSALLGTPLITYVVDGANAKARCVVAASSLGGFQSIDFNTAKPFRISI